MSDNPNLQQGIDGREFMEWIADYWSDKACQFCEGQNWTLLKETFELREFHGGTVVLGSGPIVPVMVIVCELCGNIELFNAVKVKQIQQIAGSRKKKG